MTVNVPSQRHHGVAGDNGGVVAQCEADGIREFDGVVGAGQPHWYFLCAVAVFDSGRLYPLASCNVCRGPYCCDTVPWPEQGVEGVSVATVASRPGVLWAHFPTHLSLESGPVLLSNTPLCRTGAMTLFSFTQCNEDVFSSNSQERLPLSSFSLGLASSAAAVPGQPLLCPRGEGVRSLRSRPLVATALTIQTTSIACYWIQATHMPSGGYGLSIHRYPILCRGVHDPVITVYVKVKAACFTIC